MTLHLKKVLTTFLAAIILGMLYAALIGLITYPMRASLISWPIWTILFWLLFWKFNLLRFSGYLAVLPLSLLAFEVARTIMQPPVYAFQYMSLDRSHYTPNVHVTKPKSVSYNQEKLKESYIGKDGFRADPKTGRGNPARCRHVLIGDSMIYGSGLPYSDTLGPVLEKMNIHACVFGVTGNSPIDYLATLAYVQHRIEDDAHIAIYIYAYNDFVTLTKYLERDIRGLSPAFAKLTAVIDYYDEWRRTTFVQGFLRNVTTAPRQTLQLWHLRVGKTGEIEIYWPHDPSDYQTPPVLNRAKRATFQVFLQRLREIVANRPWQVSIVFIPDNEEMLANLAHRSQTFQDLDQRRVEALKMCVALWSYCHDLTLNLFDQVNTEGQNPYLPNDRHLSLFGNRVLAEHYVSIAKQKLSAKAPPHAKQTQ